MAEDPTLLLRARLVLPVDRPAIENGAVFINGDRISAVGKWPELKGASAGRTLDLGEAVLLPGLINAHCHLDYTHMAGCLPPVREFSDWIKGILAFKANWAYTEFAASWLEGAAMLLRHGCTSVIDIESVPELLPDVFGSTSLQVLSCLEMTGVKGGRKAGEILAEAETHVRRLESAQRTAGLSPHALYSTPEGLIEQSIDWARASHRLVTTHVAESASEFELYTHGRGAMFDWLSSQRSLSDAGSGTPVQQLARRGALHSGFLAVHANYLLPDDIPLLAENEVTVVHCPRSHDYFQHEAFPLEKLMKAGVNICLGTDSLATVRTGRRGDVELDLFAEMRALRKSFPGLAPDTVLRMVTVQSARIGFALEKRGRLSPGLMADLIAVPHAGPLDEALDALIDFRDPVCYSMIAGKQVVGTELKP